MMGMVLRLAHRQELLQTRSDYIESCLPKSESFLRNNQKILRLLRKRIGEDKYKSVMDAVLCSFFPDRKKACFEYYEGKGKLLIELLSKKTIAAMDAHILNSLTVLKGVYQDILEKELWDKKKEHTVAAFDEALIAIGWEEES